MEFSYRLTWQIWRDAQRLRYWTTIRKITVAMFLFLSVIIAVFIVVNARENPCECPHFWDYLSDDWPLVLLLLLLLALPSAAFVLPHIIAARSFPQLPGKDEDTRVSVNAEMLEVEIPNVGRSSFKWSLYNKWREGRATFLLKLRTGQAQFLPKATLTAEQIAELRSILSKALPRG